MKSAISPITYTFTPIDYEQIKDAAGIVTSMFISINVIDSKNNQYVYEYYLTPAEVASVLIGATTIDSIFITQSKNAQIACANWVDNKPQPPISDTAVVLASIIIPSITI